MLNGYRLSLIVAVLIAACDSTNPPPPPATSIEECFADLQPPAISFVEIQRFISTDDSKRLWIARQPGDRDAVGETFAYDLVRFAIQEESAFYCGREASRLLYEFGHHNWDERGEARFDDVNYVFTLTLDINNQTWNDRLTAYDAATDEVLWGPVDLDDDGCTSMPYDLNPCFRRTRLDQ